MVRLDFQNKSKSLGKKWLELCQKCYFTQSVRAIFQPNTNYKWNSKTYEKLWYRAKRIEETAQSRQKALPQEGISSTQKSHSYCRFTFNQKTRIPIFTTMSTGNWICLERSLCAKYKYLHFWIVEAFLNWNTFQLLYCKCLTHRYIDAKWIKIQKVITFLFGKEQKYFYRNKNIKGVHDILSSAFKLHLKSNLFGQFVLLENKTLSILWSVLQKQYALQNWLLFNIWQIFGQKSSKNKMFFFCQSWKKVYKLISNHSTFEPQKTIKWTEISDTELN
jgi:hypothetical protein